MALSAGTRLGPYEILSALGAGGMGEVYRARDTKLNRDVAIKVLPEALAADPDRIARFEREALAVASLSHPNILAIFDFGNHDGVAYAVMELLEGGTLRDKLEAGSIPQKQAIDLATQIARGLSAAHEKGIVHRDLKPENLFVAKDGHLKILDFGLATRAGPVTAEEASNAATTTSTKPGTVMGTVGYMSPEQVRGLAVDHRSDIFSFGTILYEMLSGRKPFKRDTDAETMMAILKEDPPEPSESGTRVPPALDHIVKRCLEKSPDQRFQSAHDLAFALEELSSPAVQSRGRTPLSRFWLAMGVVLLVAVAVVAFLVPRTAKSTATAAARAKQARLVVLPFENLGAPEDAYFAAGMTEEIISRLGNLQGLAVISRTTAIGYDRNGKTIRQIGADLGVDFVLEGTIRWDRSAGRESRVRIAPQLIQVADDTHIWADRYDRVIADIFAIQSDVAENVVRAMGVKLVAREERALKTVSTNDLEAYDFYIRGLEMVSRGYIRESQLGALRMFQAAVDRDPRFTQALMWLATTHLQLNWLHLDRERGHIDRAKDAVDRLAALGPDLPETQIARAWYTSQGLMDFPKAVEEFKAALLLQPGNTDALDGESAALRRQGRWEEATAVTTKRLEIDPRNPLALWQHGLNCVCLRRYAEANRVYDLSASLSPQSGNTWARRAWVQVLWRGDVEKARSILSDAGRVAGLQDDVDFVAWTSFRVALIRRDYQGALQQLEGQKREALSSQFFFLPIELLRGEVYALSGQQDLARRSYEAARRRLELVLNKKPDDSYQYYSPLGIAYAGLGLREEALRAAKRGIELESADPWHALWRNEDLALVHAMLGQQNEAIDRLDYLLKNTGEISTHVLRLDPRWDPIRSNPRFNALLAKYSVKP